MPENYCDADYCDNNSDDGKCLLSHLVISYEGVCLDLTDPIDEETEERKEQ